MPQRAEKLLALMKGADVQPDEATLNLKPRLPDPFKTPPDFRQSQPCQMTSRPIKKVSSALHVTRRRGLTTDS